MVPLIDFVVHYLELFDKKTVAKRVIKVALDFQTTNSMTRYYIYEAFVYYMAYHLQG